MQKVINISLHIIYWIVFLAFSLALSYKIDEGWDFALTYYKAIIINTVWAAITFYSFYYYFLPKFLEKGKYVQYLIISVVFSLSISSFFLYIFDFIYPETISKDFRLAIGTVIGTFIIAQCGSLIKGFVNWFTNTQLKAELENQNLKNELAVLRAQINPHFLFNTLNNIDSLIFKSQEKASEALIKLSEIMRYMIHDCNTEKVDLHDEIKHITNIIELQKLRFREEKYILFKIEGEIPSRQIEPMMFLSFIENAFKYTHDTGVYPAIQIILKVNNEGIYFQCHNFFDPNRKTNDSTKTGINNVKRRLELFYPKKFEYKAFQEDNYYKMFLKIDFDTN